MQHEPVVIKRRKAMHYCTLYGLTRQDRLDLAEMLLRRDISTWKDLDDDDMTRLLDALEGFGLVSHLMQTRQPYTSKTA